MCSVVCLLDLSFTLSPARSIVDWENLGRILSHVNLTLCDSVTLSSVKTLLQLSLKCHFSVLLMIFSPLLRNSPTFIQNEIIRKYLVKYVFIVVSHPVVDMNNLMSNVYS